jgi:hypothetical protein
MDLDNDGKVSEQECMKYMQAEFKRLQKEQGGLRTFGAAGK